MRTLGLWLAGAAVLGCCEAALADRVAGLAGIAPARAASVQPAVPAPALRSGIVSAVAADGSSIEIDGQRYVLKPGRSLLLRNGLPVGASVLSKGQKVSYSLASTTPGESALGVVHVP